MAISQDLANYIQAVEQTNNSMEEYFKLIKCPSCSRAYNIIHFECSNYVDVCPCPKEADQVYYCNPCDLLWDEETDEQYQDFTQGNKIASYDDDSDEWYDDSFLDYNAQYPSHSVGTKSSLFDDDEYEYWDPTTGVQGSLLPQKSTYTKTLTTTGGTTTATQYNFEKCSHKHQRMPLFDGTPIYCSSVRGTASDNTKPDFGLYADSIWKPTWRNEFITWPDYDIPTNEMLGLEQIKDAYHRAVNGEMVEIGCIGGHGRTGTILAIMYILSADGEVTPKQAYNYVKEKYCSSAIESEIQEWYIEYASHVWFNTALPEKPQTFGATSYGCSVANHSAMMLRGHTQCVDRGKACKYWTMDWNTFWKEKTTPTKADWDALKTAIDKSVEYDYVYGGKIRFENDPQLCPCQPTDHYVMITKGHETCLRFGDECQYWKLDQVEWNETGKINHTNDWNPETVKALQALYPSVEDLPNQTTVEPDILAAGTRKKPASPNGTSKPVNTGAIV